MLIIKTKSPLPHGSQFVVYKGYLLLLKSEYPSYYIAQVLDVNLCQKLLDSYQEIKDNVGVCDHKYNFMKKFGCLDAIPMGHITGEEDYNFRYIGETLNGASLHLGRGRECLDKRANNNDVETALYIFQHGNNFQSVYIHEKAEYENLLLDQLDDKLDPIDLLDEQIEFVAYKENAESYCIIDSKGVNSYTYSQALDLVTQKEYLAVSNVFAELNQEHYQYMTAKEKKHFRNERCLSLNAIALVNTLFNLNGGC